MSPTSACFPRDTLRRGYAIVQTADGGVVRGAEDLSGATPVHVTLGAGTATGTLEPDGPGPDGV
ncbi:hypothetical protein [Curtobacterium sp. B18]|uniref:hypothetical protein n=1 Tax=Curtobacterium sp. B18 TaxID=95614 RepID=UPI0003B56CB7|nr:hypothetical protein [Curtobacterium sp. B18]